MPKSLNLKDILLNYIKTACILQGKGDVRCFMVRFEVVCVCVCVKLYIAFPIVVLPFIVYSYPNVLLCLYLLY